MAPGMLTVAVFSMFVLGFYIASKADQFLDSIQETVKDKREEKQPSSKILFLNTLSDEELLKAVHEFKSQYKEVEIIIFDGQAGD